MDKLNAKIDTLFNLAYEKERKYPPEYYRHCEKWVDVYNKRIVTDFPIQLVIETNTSCNLKCPMCMRRQLNLPNDNMKLSQFVKLIDEAKQYKDWESIKPNYRNEPTLHPELDLFLEYAKRAGAIEIIMNTNGNYHPLKIKKYASNLTEIAFSIDATGPHTYNIVRPGGKYDLVELNAMNAIKETVFHKNLRVRTAFVIQEENKDEARNFLEMWKQRGADKIVVNHCFNPGQKGTDRGIIEWKQKEHFVCPQIYQRLVVTTQGNIIPCCGAYDESLSLGNIFKDNLSLYDIWHGRALENLRDMHESGAYKDIPTCSKCVLSYECMKPKMEG